MPVLMWSPMEQYSDLFPNGVKCPKCNSGGNGECALYCKGWKDGSQVTSSEPRVIHDVDGIVLLVGRVYHCNHTVVAHSPGIINQFPITSLIPFRLWHRTGFTVELMECISSLVSAGLTILALKHALGKEPCRDSLLSDLHGLNYFSGIHSCSITYAPLCWDQSHSQVWKFTNPSSMCWYHLDMPFQDAFLHTFGRRSPSTKRACREQHWVNMRNGSVVITHLSQLVSTADVLETLQVATRPKFLSMVTTSPVAVHAG